MNKYEALNDEILVHESLEKVSVTNAEDKTWDTNHYKELRV